MPTATPLSRLASMTMTTMNSAPQPTFAVVSLETGQLLFVGPSKDAETAARAALNRFGTFGPFQRNWFESSRQKDDGVWRAAVHVYDITDLPESHAQVDSLENSLRGHLTEDRLVDYLMAVHFPD